jgi:predicted nucleic acid-binding protein
MDLDENEVKSDCKQPIFINGTKVLYVNTAKYLGMSPDAKLRWKERIKKKRDELNIKFMKMYWLLRRNSELSIHNKLTLYNKLYIQVGVIVSSSGAEPVILILK